MVPPDALLGSPLGKLLWGSLAYTRWPVTPLPSRYRSLQDSDVEALLLSGSADFSTAAEFATGELFPRLHHGRQVILAEAGHVPDVWNVMPSRTNQSGDSIMMQKGKPLRAPFSFFVDGTVQPGLADFRKILGRACRAWDDLEALLSRTFGLKARIHFMYGERYGWALRFERSGRLVAAMYPNRGRLSVQVILNRAQVDTAMAMRLPPHVARALETARDYPEGRWLFIPVKSRKSAGELRTILTLKIPLPAGDGNRRADSGNG